MKSKRLFLTIFVLGLLGALVYAWGNRSPQTSQLGEVKQERSVAPQEVVDCNKKIGQKQEIAQADPGKNDCVFIGCSDFLQ